jgi:hypothetical protein
MHRSGTSAATRLLNLLGLWLPREDDLVPPSEKNPRGYWESMSLVAFNERVLAAVGSHIRCPLALEPGWELDARLAALRGEAPAAFAAVFTGSPWVWKDPRMCLAQSFWRRALEVEPAVVLVNRNPLEISASTRPRAHWQGKAYDFALWERYVRQALAHLGSGPVRVTNYAELLSAPYEWCERMRSFVASSGLAVREARENEVSEFVDVELRHATFSRGDFLNDADASDEQRALFLALEELERSDSVVAPSLPPETPSTERLLSELRRSRAIQTDLDRLRGVDGTRQPLYRRLLRWAELRR